MKSQNSRLFQNGFSVYGSVGPNKWWCNANPENMIGFTMATGFDKNVARWLAFGVDYEFGMLTGDRVVGPYQVFNSTTYYSKPSFLAYLELSSLFKEPQDVIFDLRFFGGVSYLIGSNTITENPDRDWRTYYDLKNTSSGTAQMTYTGGVSFEINVAPRMALFARVAGTWDTADELDGVGALTVYATENGQYEYYDFDNHLWVTSDTRPSDDELELGWHDNFASIQFGIRYRVSKHGARIRKKQVKSRGPRDNYGNYKLLPRHLLDFQGADGMEKY